MVKKISTPRKINIILLNIKINQQNLVDVWIYTSNKLAKFHENILSLSENIAKSFREATFLTQTVDCNVLSVIQIMIQILQQ